MLLINSQIIQLRFHFLENVLQNVLIYFKRFEDVKFNDKTG